MKLAGTHMHTRAYTHTRTHTHYLQGITTAAKLMELSRCFNFTFSKHTYHNSNMLRGKKWGMGGWEGRGGGVVVFGRLGGVMHIQLLLAGEG